MSSTEVAAGAALLLWRVLIALKLSCWERLAGWHGLGLANLTADTACWIVTS